MRIDTAGGQHPVRPVGQPGVLRLLVPVPGQLAARLGRPRRGRLPVRLAPAPRPLRRRAPARGSFARRRPCCCPSSRPASSRTSCATLGFTSFLRDRRPARSIELDGGLKIMIQALTSRPTGRSATRRCGSSTTASRLLNQNDARPADLSAFAELGHVHAHLLQFSGAIWYPMVYELPAGGQAARSASRSGTGSSTARCATSTTSRRAGCSRSPGRRASSTTSCGSSTTSSATRATSSPTSRSSSTDYAELGHDNGSVLLPGIGRGARPPTTARSTHPVTDVDEFFANKEQHLREYQARQRPVIEAAKASWRHPEIDVLAELKRADRAAAGGVDLPGHGRRRAGPLRPDRRRRRRASSRSWSTSRQGGARRRRREGALPVPHPARAVEHLLHIGEVDWVNSLFLSCRFSAARIGQYNEFVYAFFKCLSEERLQYAEGWYAEQKPRRRGRSRSAAGCAAALPAPEGRPDPVRDHRRRRPYLPVHGWKFDLASGRCLTSAGTSCGPAGPTEPAPEAARPS